MAGLVVSDVNPTGQAASVGIRAHDVIYQYNGGVLNTVEDLIFASRSTQAENKLTVIRGSELLDLTVPPGSLGVGLLPYPQPDQVIPGVAAAIARIGNAVQLETQALREEALAGVIITTTPSIDGYRVTKTVDVITAEYVGGMNIFRDIMATWTDALGGRSGTLQNELRNARVVCLASLKSEAVSLGANAVIGVDLDYSEISGGGKSMLFLVASGTAVVVEKEGEEAQ